MSPINSLRTRLLLISATTRFPDVSKASRQGLYSCALVAALPSPAEPAVPVPVVADNFIFWYN